MKKKKKKIHFEEPTERVKYEYDILVNLSRTIRKHTKRVSQFFIFFFFPQFSVVKSSSKYII